MIYNINKMKTIGIRLADGTFYPVLKEESPCEKSLELTTVHNNQTKIMVDLYRSELGDMSDAEYVDSLQIDNLVAHPNGEADINFIASIDEDNHLSVQIIDKETGMQSKTEVTLVEHQLEERKTGDDSIPAVPQNEENEGELAAMGVEVLSDSDTITETEETDMDDLKKNPEDDFNLGIPEEELNTSDETLAVEPLEEDTPVEDPLAGLDLDLPDIPDTTSEDTSSDDTSADTLPDFDLDLPSTDAPAEDTPEEDAPVEDTLAGLDLDLPDISDTSSEDTSSDDTSADALPDFDLDLPDENSPSFNDEDTSLLDFDFQDTIDMPNNTTSSSPSAGFDFDGLYDDEDESKKTRAPLIICIICAIICVLATAAILFIIPSRFNLLGKMPEEPAPVVQQEIQVPETPVEEPKPEIKAEVQPEPEPIVEPEIAEVPPAQEDEIVVIEQAELVVPEQPPVIEEKPKNITYKIKWGDTLWDIADTYYKNPWRYKEIARFNGIKDPDHIISGTIIIIPAE